MKIIKYILFTAIAVALWITAPIWMPKSQYQSTTIEEAEKKSLLKSEEEKLTVLESKFGKKTSVIPLLKKHWNETYMDATNFEFIKCSDVIAGNEGWTTVCSYRVTGFMRKQTYIVNNGKISKKVY